MSVISALSSNRVTVNQHEVVAVLKEEVTQESLALLLGPHTRRRGEYRKLPRTLVEPEPLNETPKQVGDFGARRPTLHVKFINYESEDVLLGFL
ncbi:hypothetical protein AB0N64_10885 [Microbacterium sp. NPDC089318]